MPKVVANDSAATEIVRQILAAGRQLRHIWDPCSEMPWGKLLMADPIRHRSICPGLASPTIDIGRLFRKLEGFCLGLARLGSGKYRVETR